MSIQEKRNHAASNRRRWSAHVKALGQSGLSRAEYCRQYNLSYHAMTYWWRRFSPSKESTSILVPVPFHPLNNKIEQTASEPMRVILPGGLSVEIRDNFSELALTRLLAMLERR
jgi:transposase-like protein